VTLPCTDATRSTRSWLIKNKKFQGDARDFKRKVESIWFGLYRRETQSDSSGFEHVFVGEEKNVRRQPVSLSVRLEL
jgi:hypothetical protein